mmetsp:Transcript_14835/g.35812  ORF Transcript_14835/g.35812 Transcript_14835/m.35812 type:complete len:87 (+) Transcript_14835:464-724(+)
MGEPETSFGDEEQEQQGEVEWEVHRGAHNAKGPPAVGTRFAGWSGSDAEDEGNEEGELPAWGAEEEELFGGSDDDGEDDAFFRAGK